MVCATCATAVPTVVHAVSVMWGVPVLATPLAMATLRTTY